MRRFGKAAWKALSGVLVLALFAAIVAACTGGGATTTTTTTSPTTTRPTTTVPTTTANTTTPTTTTPTTTPPTTTNATGLGSVEVLGVWGGTELDSFNAMVAPWQQQTGGKMNFTGTRDLTAILTTRLQAGNPPDIAVLPNPGLMNQYAAAGYLKSLTNMLNMTTINQQYPKAWLDICSANGTLYAIPMRAANKSMVWYNPAVFKSNNWTVPTTWDQMLTLSNTIVNAHKTPANPWAMGVESGSASGWPGTDWIAQIFLEQNGGDVYDQWVNHQIPWTDPRIKTAWNMWGTIVNTPNYVPGGAATVLATNFQDASYWPFQSPPKAAMYYEGDFVEGFIIGQFPNLKPQTDFDFFPFPVISSNITNAVTGGADLMVVFKDTPTVRSFISYIASPQAQDIWVKRGGFISLNKQIAVTDYPDPVVQKSVQQLLGASLFRFGAGDSMPAAMQTAWWAAVLQYLQNPASLDSILSNLENTARTVYGH